MARLQPKLGKIAARFNEAYVMDARNNRVDGFDAWKSRIDEVDALIRGDWNSGTTSEADMGGDPAVMNIADQMPRDVARLACEVMPSYRAAPLGESQAAVDNATVRGLIGEGYFRHNRFDTIRPSLVMDLVITGAAFLVHYIDPNRPYPVMQRVDPRAAYPDVYNGSIQDLLVRSKMKIRVADRLYPWLNIGSRLAELRDVDLGEIEVLDYYTDDGCVKAIGLVGIAGDLVEAHIIDEWDPGVLPVSFAQMPSPDGAFRGALDQIGGSLAAKNKAVNLMLEYTEQMVYSPWESKGIVNPTDPPGLDTIYVHDPAATTETFQRRVEPAGSNPQVFGLVQYLDDEQRKQLAFPASRQGDSGVSQGSAAYVQSTMGQLTSYVREVQRMLQSMQEDSARVMFKLDEDPVLDFDKPLIRNIGRKRTYKPTRDIDGAYWLMVNYGAGAGLDRLNTDVRLLQFYSAGVLSAEKMLAETDFVADAADEMDKREKEEIRRVILQRFAGDPTVNLDFIIMAYKLQKERGISLVDAYVAVMEEQEMSSQQQPEEAAGMGDQGPEAMEPGAQQEALQKGGTDAAAGAPPIPGSFSPPPLQQVFVK